MPKERLSMRKIKEVLRLRWGCGLSQRQIAESCSIARSTVGEYVLWAQAAETVLPLSTISINYLLFFKLFLDPACVETRTEPSEPLIPTHHQQSKISLTSDTHLAGQPVTCVRIAAQKPGQIEKVNRTLTLNGRTTEPGSRVEGIFKTQTSLQPTHNPHLRRHQKRLPQHRLQKCDYTTTSKYNAD